MDDSEDRRRGATDVVARLTEEGIVLRGCGARVTITHDGDVISSDL